MMTTLRLIFKSLLNRKVTTFLTILSIAFSVALLLGVERVRVGARESFSNTISQTDLIVGAKGGTVQLLLYAVFRMGSATDNITYKSYLDIKNNPAVEWTIPYSLGDSHMGYRVVGTDENFYTHLRYRGDKKIEFAQGQLATGVFDVVLGSEAAENLQYKVGDRVVVTHGVTEGRGIIDHKDKPFAVVGILKKTGTPVDKSIYITLEGMEAVHIDWQSGAPPMPGQETPATSLRKEDIKIGQITAFLLRSKSRIQTLGLQREINSFASEPLMAIIPAVTLNELWSAIGYAEQGLRLVTFFVLIVGFIGMLVSIYNSLESRRREMSILRAIGAGPARVVSLLVGEATLLTVSGAVLGVLLAYLVLKVSQPIVETEFGLTIPTGFVSEAEWYFLLAAIVVGFVIGFIPAIKAYRNSLTDGLSPKL